jgi:outer membrane protein TolC
MRAELEFAQPLYTFGQLGSLRRAAEAGLEVEDARLAETRLDVSLEVKELYYGLLLAEDLLGLVQRLTDELESWESSLDPDDPDVPLSGPYRLQLAKLELDSRRRELGDRQGVARAALAWKAGLPEGELQLADEALQPAPAAVPELDSLYALAIRWRPEWRQLRTGIAAKEALRDAAVSAYYPQVYLAGGVRYAVAPNRTDQHNPFVKDEFNYLNAGVFLGFRQSFEWGLLGADVQEARAELFELKAKERTAIQGIRVDVRRAHGEFHQSQTRLAAAREARSIGREWVQIARDEYDLDPGQLKELVSAFESFAVLEQQYREAIYEHNLRLARLERAVGLPLGIRGP